jgi:hypothetical protein
MKSINCLFLVGLALHCVVGIAIASDIGKSYQLYHKLGSQSELTPRGKILISPSDNDGNSLSATFIKDNSAKLDTNAFDSMVDSNALYTVVVIEDGDDKSSLSLSSLNGASHVSASVPGCSLRRSNLREEISLSISPTGKLQSVSYRPLISPLASKSCDNLKSLSEKPEAIYGREGGNDESFHSKQLWNLNRTPSSQPQTTLQPRMRRVEVQFGLASSCTSGHHIVSSAVHISLSRCY